MKGKKDRWTETPRKGLRLLDWQGRYGKDPFSRPLPAQVRAVDVFQDRQWFGGRKAKKKLPVGALMMAANHVPEAVVKLASWGSGKASAIAQFDYVSRDGELEVELDDGTVLQGKEDIRELVADWSDDFHHRKDGKARNTVHFVVSAPAGADRDAVQDAAREWAKDVFGENHAYGMVRHDDADHPHIHVIAKVRGRDRSRFTVGRDDFLEFREYFAQRCREQGIDMNATPRETRGTARGESLALRKMRESGRTPHIDDVARRLVTVEKSQPRSARARKARTRRRAGLRREAQDHRELASALQTAGTLAGGNVAIFEGQAAALYRLADYLERGGETSRPDKFRGDRGNQRSSIMAKATASDMEDTAANAYHLTERAEKVAERMVQKLPPGDDRAKAQIALNNLTRAREALDSERENTPLMAADGRIDRNVAPKAPGRGPQREPESLMAKRKGPPRTARERDSDVKKERERRDRDRDDDRDR